MWSAIITWLANRLLDLALKEATSRLAEAQAQIERDKTNAENAKKYREAKDREERIRRATDLLNGTK